MTRVSILGLTDYTSGHVWDDLVLPDGVDRQDVIDYICSECAEISLLYSRPETVQRKIGIWSRKNLANWRRILKALTEDYDPLHNYDRYEDWTDDGKTSVAGFNQAAGMTDRDAAQTTHKGHLYGNIGVTTAAQMIAGEMEVRTQYTLQDAILASFKNDFCVLVY